MFTKKNVPLNEYFNKGRTKWITQKLLLGMLGEEELVEKVIKFNITDLPNIRQIR